MSRKQSGMNWWYYHGNRVIVIATVLSIFLSLYIIRVIMK